MNWPTASTEPAEAHESTDVVLYGFGRIGRLLARLMLDRAGGGHSLRLRAIVVRKGNADNDLEKRASLLRRDSVHGSFKGTIQIDEESNAIIANGNYIKVIFADGPDQVDYTQYGIKNALVIDNTGKWRDEAGLSLHLQSKGVARALLTAPGKGVKNIVMGVNHNDINDDDRVLSAASCTTNAIVPVLKAVNDQFGVVNGHVETVHSYTNDQNLIDNYHKGDRRGRAAALNMVLTETGAAKAVAKALPELEGKLTGNAIRVPTPNVSMAILNLNLEKSTDKDELNAFLRDAALHSDLQKQIDYSNSPEAVSSDFVGSRAAGVVDALATIVDGNRCVLYVWYDNEFGYSCQVVRMAQHLAKCTLQAFPKKQQVSVCLPVLLKRAARVGWPFLFLRYYILKYNIYIPIRSIRICLFITLFQLRKSVACRKTTRVSVILVRIFRWESCVCFPARKASFILADRVWAGA